jgi:hypothetical protein
MMTLERFAYPSRYVVQNRYDKRFMELGKDILYNCDQTEILITIKDITIVRSTSNPISIDSWNAISECRAELLTESRIHPIKAAILNLPRQFYTHIGMYDDETGTLEFGGTQDTPYYRIHSNGLLRRLDFRKDPDMSDENYAWMVTRYIVMNFSIEKSSPM